MVNARRLMEFLRAIIPQRLHARLPEFVHLVARFCMGAERRRLAMIASSYYPTLVL